MVRKSALCIAQSYQSPPLRQVRRTTDGLLGAFRRKVVIGEQTKSGLRDAGVR